MVFLWGYALDVLLSASLLLSVADPASDKAEEGTEPSAGVVSGVLDAGAEDPSLPVPELGVLDGVEEEEALLLESGVDDEGGVLLPEDGSLLGAEELLEISELMVEEASLLEEELPLPGISVPGPYRYTEACAR